MILSDLTSCTGCTGLVLACISLRAFANVFAMLVLEAGTYLNDGSSIDLLILNKKQCKERLLLHHIKQDV
jgi:hypothetical protein